MDASVSFQLDHSSYNRGSSSPYEQAYPDFNTPASPDPQQQQSLPPTPFTPSYAAQAGSYANSPYGSDLSFAGQHEFDTHDPLDPSDPLVDLSFNIPIDIDQNPGPSDYDNSYDPSAYDAPAEKSLLFSGEFLQSLNDASLSSSKDPFTSQYHNQQGSSSPTPSNSSMGSNLNHTVSVSVTPAHDEQRLHGGMGFGSYSPYDHGSPASSNGDVSGGRMNRSRASSISSAHNQGQHYTQDSQGQHEYTNSYDFTQSQQQHFSQSQSPPPGAGQFPMSQFPTSPPNSAGLPQKPMSPPALCIPGSPPAITHTTAGSPSPTQTTFPERSMLPSNGNASGGLGAAMIQIVPATPVSAGTGAVNGAAGQIGLGAGQSQSLPSSHQGTASPGTSIQNLPQLPPMTSNSLAQLPRVPPSPYTFPPTMTPPPTGGNVSIGNNSMKREDTPNLGALQLGLDQQQSQQGFLIPISNSARTRSKSDTQMRPPSSWMLGADTHSSQQGNDSQVQYSDIMGFGTPGQQPLPSLPSLGLSPGHPPAMQHPSLPPSHYSYGPPVHDPSGSDGNNGFLSPNFNMPGIAASDGLRRSKSESSPHYLGHKRNALSEDIRSSSYGNASVNNSLFPPMNTFTSRSGSGATTPSIGGSPAMGQRYLTPEGDFGMSSMGLGSPNMGGLSVGMTGSGFGAHRRSWSGGHGHSRSLSRERGGLGASPYPSPHASPRANSNEPLPGQDALGMSIGLPSLYGQQSPPLHQQQGDGISVHVMGTDANGRMTVQSAPPLNVARQNVTTHATADASQRRRRTEANFVCPVPGCGSTFTRHFNLKGHLRSHNEERPFKCKWPGCDKGFARQHDCKRHEQLHLNIRPYVCQGCQRTFARMDALNRHLRSDAGTDCQARQPLLTSDQPNNPQALSGNTNDGNGFGNGNDDEWKPGTGGGVVV